MRFIHALRRIFLFPVLVVLVAAILMYGKVLLMDRDVLLLLIGGVSTWVFATTIEEVMAWSSRILRSKWLEQVPPFSKAPDVDLRIVPDGRHGMYTVANLSEEDIEVMVDALRRFCDNAAPTNLTAAQYLAIAKWRVLPALEERGGTAPQP